MIKLFTKFIPILLILLFLNKNISGQNGTIKGTIVDQNKYPLIGATVIIKGTTNGVITNSKGEYVFENILAGEVILLASFIGFNSQEATITVQENQIINYNFVLTETILELDEVVSIGYGSKRKRDITSSIASVRSEDINDAPVPSLQAGLQGRAAGVQISQSNGMPGGQTTVRIRGITSITASSEPLYIIDGIPIITGNYSSGWADGTSTLSAISPSDIESIEILKDASAAAIYGARAANGVILITTKSGKEGKTRIQFDYTTGVNQITNVPEYLSGPEYLKYGKIAWANSGNDTTNNYQAFYDALPFGITREVADSTDTDWIDVMSRKGIVHQANLSITGGNQRSRFYMSGSYRDEEGVQIGNDYQRLTGKINYDLKASDRLKVGTRVNMIHEINERVPTGQSGGLGTAQSRSLPIMPIYDSTGNFWAPTTDVNVLAYDTYMDYAMNILTTIGNVYAQYSFTDWLYFKTETGINIYDQIETMYESEYIRGDGLAYSKDRRIRIFDYTTNNTLNFDKKIGTHHISSLVGLSYQNFKHTENYIEGRGFANPALRNPQNAAIKTGGGYETEYRFLSYYGRINYNLNNTYYLDLSIRKDGSSRFGQNKRFSALFPAVSLGWSVSEEPFFNSQLLTFLKLRASVGKQGNAEMLSNLPYLELWTSSNYLSEAGLTTAQAPNPNLGWESTTQYDAGLDYQLWKGRISGGFDYYFKKTSDLLINRPLQSTSGFLSVYDNVGIMHNYGVEFFITTNNLSPDNALKWKTSFNISWNKNEVVDVDGKMIRGEQNGNTHVVEGYPIGVKELVEWAGIYKNTEAMTKTVTDWLDPNDESEGTTEKEITIMPGDELFINYWGEVTNEFNFDRDAKFVGQSYPDYVGGIRNTLEYKGIDLNIFFSFILGQDVYRDDGKFLMGGFDGNWNQLAVIKDAWSEDNPDGSSHKLYWAAENRNYNSTRYLEDASYLRLKTLTLGYSLPKNLLTQIKAENIRFYVSAINLWTLTNYKGWDPEVNRDGARSIAQGITYLSPPQVKTYSVGIQIVL